METYIFNELLNKGICVIPKLGVFKLIDKKAEIHPVTHIVKPPVRIVSFELEKTSIEPDWDKIAHFFNCTSEEAQSKVENFVNKITSLNKGETIDLPNIGRFTKNVINELVFEPSDFNYNPDTFGLEELKAEMVVTDAAKHAKGANKEKNNTSTKKKNVLIIALISIVVLMTAFFVAFYFNIGGLYDLLVKANNNNQENVAIIDTKNKEIQDNVDRKDSLKILDSTEKNENSKQVEDISEIPALPYCIIAGSFSDENNANNFKDKIKDKGFENTEIIKHGGKYLVSCACFSTSQEAEIFLRKNQSELKGAWILKR